MSDVKKVIEEKISGVVERAEVSSALDSLFKERDSIKPEENQEEAKPKKTKGEDLSDNKSENKQKEIKETSKKTVEPEEKDSDGKNIENKGSNKKEDLDEDEVRSLELEKLKKALNDSQKWGHSNNKRLKSTLKMIGSLKEEGILNEDEFNKLNDLLTSEAAPEIEEGTIVSKNPIVNLIQIANKRIGDLREIYDKDDLFDKKVAAFDFCIENSSEQERDDILDELEPLMNSDLKLAKKMYDIGEKFYEEVYKDVDQAGGLKSFIIEKNTEIARMKKKIDKLEKKILQSDEYDTPTFKIDELSESEVEGVTTKKPRDTLEQLFEERDRIKR